MRDGIIHEGIITDVDPRHVFLRVDSPRCTISGFGFFGGAILTLALFDLLAIALI